MASYRELRLVHLAAIAALVSLLHVEPANTQILKRLAQGGGCMLGGAVGARLGEELAEREAEKRNLTGDAARDLEKQYKTGFALALCGGGAALAGTTYEKLSERGRQAREREVLSALDDAQPHSYVDPENPELAGTVVPQPITVEGDEECRVVEDRLGSDAALIKYCRSPGGAWEVKTV